MVTYLSHSCLSELEFRVGEGYKNSKIFFMSPNSHNNNKVSLKSQRKASKQRLKGGNNSNSRAYRWSGLVLHAIPRAKVMCSRRS